MAQKKQTAQFGVRNKKGRVLYPGSFDPVTHGHIDVVKRLSQIFDEVTVLVANSPRKKYLFTHTERVQLLEKVLAKNRNVKVKASEILTVDFARQEGISVIARSVRTVSDWEYEYSMADANKKLNSNLETLFIMADPQYAFISSTLVREIAIFNGDTSAFVPDVVSRAIRKKAKL